MAALERTDGIGRDTQGRHTRISEFISCDTELSLILTAQVALDKEIPHDYAKKYLRKLNCCDNWKMFRILSDKWEV